MPVMKFFNTVARHGAKEVTRQFLSSAKTETKVAMQCSLTGFVKAVAFTPKQPTRMMVQCSLTGFFKEENFTPPEEKPTKVIMQCSLTGFEKEVDLGHVLPKVPSYMG